MSEKIKKKELFKSIHFFLNLLKKKQLVSSEREFFLLKKIVKKNDNVIDVGANIGRYTFKLSSIVGRNGTVYSFEPLSRIYLILISLIFLREIKNIVPLNLAVSNQSKFLYVGAIKTAMEKKKLFKFNTFTTSKVLQNSSPNTYAVRLNDLKFTKKISFIKMDCEGFELEVLIGAKNLLKKYKPTLLIEFINNGKLMNFKDKYYGKQKKMMNLLNSIGYEDVNLNFASRNKLFIHSSNKKHRAAIAV